VVFVQSPTDASGAAADDKRSTLNGRNNHSHKAGRHSVDTSIAHVPCSSSTATASINRCIGVSGTEMEHYTATIIIHHSSFIIHHSSFNEMWLAFPKHDAFFGEITSVT
jgi:hypothetical protein